MMRFLFIVIMLFYMSVPLKRSLHMIQQNRYQSGRYQTWLGAAIQRQSRQILWQTAAFLPLCGLCCSRYHHIHVYNA